MATLSCSIFSVKCETVTINSNGWIADRLIGVATKTTFFSVLNLILTSIRLMQNCRLSGNSDNRVKQCVLIND